MQRIWPQRNQLGFYGTRSKIATAEAVENGRGGRRGNRGIRARPTARGGFILLRRDTPPRFQSDPGYASPRTGGNWKNGRTMLSFSHEGEFWSYFSTYAGCC